MKQIQRRELVETARSVRITGRKANSNNNLEYNGYTP